MLFNDDRKNQLEVDLKRLKDEKKEAYWTHNKPLEIQKEAEIAETEAQLSVNEDVIRVRNSFLTGSSFSKKDQQGNPTGELLKEAKIPNEMSPDDNNNRFELEVSYPGLVTGIGIDHEVKIEGEFKLGVHFDWTYGMPVIYGSTVKGLLRSSFIAKEEKGKVVEYDDYFLKNVINRSWKKHEIEALMNDIFYGKTIKKEEGKDGSVTYKEVNKSIYNRDIFFDAVIVKPDKKGRILCSDSITPHDDNPLKNPTPHTFLKIAPGCKLQFRFKLVPTVINNGETELTLSITDKLELFKFILTTVGIGAKTNVGYGQLKKLKEG